MPHPVETAKAALHWMFGLLSGVHSSSDSPLANAITSAVRRAAPSTSHRLKMSREELLQLTTFCFRSCAPISDQRFGTLLLVTFALFMRVSEVTSIRRRDVSISDSQLSIFIPKSKTDQQGKGMTRLAARSCSPLCAVSAVERWLGGSPDSLSCSHPFLTRGFQLPQIESGKNYAGFVRWSASPAT
jgi:integrase